MNPTHISVPITQLEKLESARVRLWTEIYPHLPPDLQARFQTITPTIWETANRRNWDSEPD